MRAACLRALAPPVPQVEMGVAYPRAARSAVLPAFLQALREVIRPEEPGRARG